MKVLRKFHYVYYMDASYQASKVLLENIKLRKNEYIGIYWPINFELDTRPIIKYLSEESFRLALPAIKNNKMIFKAWTTENKLEYCQYKFFAPTSSSLTVKPSKIIVPCLAYDYKGNRVGYGKGFYDKYFYENPNNFFPKTNRKH